MPGAGRRHGLSAVEILATELQHARNVFRTVQDVRHLKDVGRVGVKVVAFTAGVGHIHQTQAGRTEGIDGFDNQAAAVTGDSTSI